MFEALKGSPLHLRVLSAYRVLLEHETKLLICSLTDKLSLTVTPKTLREVTRLMLGRAGGNMRLVLELKGPLTMISSLDLLSLNFRLKSAAHLRMCSSSVGIV